MGGNILQSEPTSPGFDLEDKTAHTFSAVSLPSSV